MKRFVAGLAMAFALAGPVWAQEADKAPAAAGAQASEMEDLKKRVEALEKGAKDTEMADELGHKLHPIHSLYGLKISGGVTMVGQGVAHLKNADHRGAFTLSADLTLESPVGKDGRVIAVLDFQRGAGLQNLPPFFTGPNGNTTGPNNDVESFDDDRVHVAQFLYEHNITPSLVVSVGQLDPTSYFDVNEYANSERLQFLANGFVNNPAIEFGGSENFYGPGARVTWWPAEYMDITLGAFEGNGDYSNVFDNPFAMAEVNLKLSPMGKEGNYRLYYWNRQGRTDVANTATPTDQGLLKAANQGVGISIDQSLSDNTGFWIRAGQQREKIAQFDRFAAAGFHAGAEKIGRPNDYMGLGYGMAFMGNDYKDFKRTSDPAFEAGDEHYIELYYTISVAGANQTRGLHITPDIQYVINPGGDKNATDLFIYGMRLQAFF